MRKEITGILLFFLVIVTLVSLLSYSPNDPSFNHVTTAQHIQNLFGILGSYLADLLIEIFFGLGAFWIPILLLLLSVQILGNQPHKELITTAFGGLLLVLATGSMLSMKQKYFLLFGEEFSAGGILGYGFKNLLINYTNMAGGALILSLILLCGFILATGFSVINFFKLCLHLILNGYQYLQTGLATLRAMHRARKEQAQIVSPAAPKPKPKKKAKLKIETPKPPPKPIKKSPPPIQEVFDFMRGSRFQLPPVSFLDDPVESDHVIDEENLRVQSKLLEKKLDDFGVKGSVAAVTPGPVVTTFEYKPAPGVKINKIVNLTDDLALALRALSIRIVAPIPGKAAIGIEIPNANRESVMFKEIVTSEAFTRSKSKMTLCLGKDIVGNPVVSEMDKMPHLLIAGATGMGKSVSLNVMISSLLYKASPDDVKLIMIDPKRIELSVYDGIPHLITPVVTDMKKATNALFWAVKEMERRYELLSQKKARNILQFNNKIGKEAPTEGEPPLEPLPYIIIVIDELADLMMVSSRDVEVALTRLAQMARAAGIHIIIATQRPSVDVLTGIIKANFPTRISFQVSSKTDSRTIIDANGAENLLGNGDMLFLPPGTAKLQRIHGAYISEDELTKIIDFLKKQKAPEYDEQITEAPGKETNEEEEIEHDARYDDAVALVTKTGQASISMVQRHLRIGYNRAARIVEVMEKEGVVGPSDGVKPREVLVKGYDEMP